MDTNLDEIRVAYDSKICKTNHLLDVLKFLCAVLIVAFHVLWPYRFENVWHFYCQEWFFRFSVPIFFISSGMFFQQMERKKQKKYIQRIFILYVICTLIYLYKIIELYASNLHMLFNQLIFGYYHLWYLSALLFALCISYFFNKWFSFSSHKKLYLVFIIFLLMFGVFFDEYYKLFENNSLNKIVSLLDYVGTTRNGLFMAFPLFSIGRFVAEYKSNLVIVKLRWYVILLILSFVLSFLESIFLCNNIGYFVSCDLTVFNWIPAILFVIITFYFKVEFLHKISPLLRKISTVVYIIHALILILLEDVWNVDSWTIYWEKFFIVLISSLVISITIVFLMDIIKIKQKNKL